MKIFRFLKDRRGFTLLEIILGMVVTGIMIGIAAEMMMQQINSYSFIANRKATMNDVRYAMNKMTHEILRLSSGDILDISSTELDFIDDTSTSTNYRLDTDGANLAVYRGTEVLIPNIKFFHIEYQDGSGNALQAVSGQIANVKRIKLELTTDAIGNEGSTTLSTTIIPRDFIGYANYQ